MRASAPVRSSRWAAAACMAVFQTDWKREPQELLYGNLLPATAAPVGGPRGVRARGRQHRPGFLRRFDRSRAAFDVDEQGPTTWIWAMLPSLGAAFTRHQLPRSFILPPNALRDATVSHSGCISSFSHDEGSVQQRLIAHVVSGFAFVCF